MPINAQIVFSLVFLAATIPFHASSSAAPSTSITQSQEVVGHEDLEKVAQEQKKFDENKARMDPHEQALALEAIIQMVNDLKRHRQDQAVIIPLFV